MDSSAGRIGLVSGGTDFWARRIVEFTHSPYHHVVVGLDAEWCMSAEPEGVKRMPNRHYPNIHWLDPIGTPHEQQAAAQHATQLADIPYNNRALALASAKALGLPVPAAAVRWAGGHGYTCVMLASAAYAAVGITLLKQPITSPPKAFLEQRWQPHAQAQPNGSEYGNNASTTTARQASPVARSAA